MTICLVNPNKFIPSHVSHYHTILITLSSPSSSHTEHKLQHQSMAESKATCTCLWLLLLLQLLLPLPPALTETPTPAAWPEQFHSVLFVNRSGPPRKTDLWHDWPNGHTFNIIQYQLGVLKYGLEWNNGPSFMYPLPPFNPTC